MPSEASEHAFSCKKGVAIEGALQFQVRIDLGAGFGGRVGKGRIPFTGWLYLRSTGLPPIA